MAVTSTFDGNGGTSDNFNLIANWDAGSPNDDGALNAIIAADCNLQNTVTMTGDLTVNAGAIMDCNGYVLSCGAVVVEGGGSPGTGVLRMDAGSAVDFYCTSIKLNQYGHLSGTAGTIYCTGAAASTNGMAFNNGENQYRHNNGTLLITNPGIVSVGYDCAVYAGANSFYNLTFSGTATECDGLYASNLIDNDLIIKGGTPAPLTTHPIVKMNWASAGQKTLTVSGDLVLETGVLEAEQATGSSNLTLQAGGGVISISDGATLDWKNGTTLDGGANIKLGGLMLTSGGTLEANQWEDNSGVYGNLYSYGDETITSSDNFKITTHCDVGCTAYFDILANKAQNTYVSGTATPTFSCDGWNSIMDPCGESTIIIDGGTGRSIYVGINDVGACYNLIISGAGTHKKISNGQNFTFYVKHDFTIQEGTTFSTDGPNYTDPYLIDVSGTMTVNGTFNGNLNTYAPDQKINSLLLGPAAVYATFDATSGTTLIPGVSGPTFEPGDDYTYYRNKRGIFNHNSGTVVVYQSSDGAGGSQPNHCKIYNVNDTTGVGYSDGSWYNAYLSGTTPGQALYVSRTGSTNALDIINDLTVDSCGFYPLGDSSIGGDVLVTDTDDSGCTFGDNPYDYSVSGNFTMTNPNDNTVKIKSADITLYGGFYNYGGTWD